MTREEFQCRYDEIDPIYSSIEQVPKRYKEETLELIALGEIPMENNKIKIRDSQLTGMILAKRLCSVAIKWSGK